MTNICYCGGVFKGSTPTLNFNINAPLENIQVMYLTFEQCGVLILEKNINDITIVDKDTVAVTLTQEETLLFSSKYDIEVQFRAKYTDGSATTSDINTFNMYRILKNEVI